MESRFAQRLLLVALFSVGIFNNSVQNNVAAHIHVAPGGAPKLQPVASPSSHHDKISPAPRAVPPVSHVSFPPSGAEPPSSPVVEFQSQDEGSQSSSSSSKQQFTTSQKDSQSEGRALYSSELQFEGHSSFNFDSNLGNIPPKLPKIVDCDPEIKRICETTVDPTLCLSTVVPFLHGKTDLFSVIGISIKVANNYAKLALNSLKRISLTPGNPERVAAVINDCKDSYEDVLYNFENAITALPARDIDTMNSMLSAVMIACGDCEDEFKSLNFPCPVSAIANQVINMTANCLAISNSLTGIRT